MPDERRVINDAESCVLESWCLFWIFAKNEADKTNGK